MAGLPNLANLDYVERVNRAIDHIHRHLDGSLRLEDVARVACFSPYHFHRIFKALAGEPLNAFIKRVRLERAVYLLSHAQPPSLTEVALACGFASSSDFSRSFRKHFGVPPSVFDVNLYRRQQRERMGAELGSMLPDEEPQILLPPLAPGENPDGFEVAFRDLAPRRVAYLRVRKPFDPHRVPEASKRLIAWATDRGLEGGQWLGYMWEDPEITPLEQCHYDVGVEVPSDTRADGDVSVVDFPSMRVAEIPIAGSIELEQRAIDWIYRTWLPTSGCVPAHQPAFEAWEGLPFEHGFEHFELRLQLAVD